jgi:hypothetical protein
MSSPPTITNALLYRLRTLHRRACALHGAARDERVRLELRRLAIEIAEIAPKVGGAPSFHDRVNASELAEAAAILLRQLEASSAPGCARLRADISP